MRPSCSPPVPIASRPAPIGEMVRGMLSKAGLGRLPGGGVGTVSSIFGMNAAPAPIGLNRVIAQRRHHAGARHKRAAWTDYPLFQTAVQCRARRYFSTRVDAAAD